MIKTLLLSISFAFPIFSIGQTSKVKFALFSSDDDCNATEKKMFLYFVSNGLDSLIRKENFTPCLMEIEIPKVVGTYHLTIEASKFEDINIAFEIKNESESEIDLKIFEFQKKTRQLDEVTISGIKRRFIQVDADKTTITVKDNPILTVSSLYDAILKIPGVVPYPGGGFAIGGKFATVFFEGIPSNLSGDDLANLLRSLPATSVEKIEIISNPGASFDANVSGAVINVVSLAKSSKWFSGTVTLNYGLNANNKILPSLILSGRSKKFGWQLQTGYSHYERDFKSTSDRTFTSFPTLTQMISEKSEKSANDFYYFKPSINYKLNKNSSIALNYNGSINSNNKDGNVLSSSREIAPAINFSNNYKTKAGGSNNEFILKYQNKLDTLKRTLSVTGYYSDYSQKQINKTTQSFDNVNEYSLLKYNLRLKHLYFKSDIEIPFEKKKLFLQGGLKYSKMHANSEGQYNLQNSDNAIFLNPTYNSAIDFDYEEDNLAGYIEMKKGFGEKLSTGLGVRVENFHLNRKSSVTPSKSNNYFNLFPSANAIYRFSSDINVIATYSRKISIPSYNQFDPNNSGYYDSYSSEAGNILLKPNFYDNFEIKFSVFDYLQLSANYSHSQTINLFELSSQPGSLQTVQTFKTYSNVNVLTYFFSVPIPFGMFKEGLSFFNNAIDIDKINFVYLYTERTKTSVADLNYITSNKASWNHGVYSQFILPFKIRMNVDYFFGTRGTYQIWNYTKPRSALEIVFTKEFLKKKLKASLTFEDIFNTSQLNFQTNYTNVNLNHYSKNDTRIVWFKLSYSFGQYEKKSSGLDLDKGGQTPDLKDGLR